MTRNVHVTPGAATATQARVGIVVAAAFLVFGLVFGAVVALESPGSESGLAVLELLFLVIWVAACVGMIVSFWRIASRKGAPADRALLDVQVDGQAGAASGGDFDARLRKLASLKRDGLLSEEEFRAKREEILRERW